LGAVSKLLDEGKKVVGETVMLVWPWKIVFSVEQASPNEFGGGNCVIRMNSTPMNAA
jgi:hypothetical protein